MKESKMSLEKLYKIIVDRKTNMPENSYVASLFKKGPDRIAQKVGEEGVEVSIAAIRTAITGEKKQRVVEETADLWFHSLILLASFGISPTIILQELMRRNNEKQK